MSLKGIRTRMGAMICALALLAVGLVVGLATNQASAATAATAAAAPTASGTVVMLTPCRVADSRQWITLSTFNAYQTQYLGVTGNCGVPWGAAGVILNVTVVPSPWFSYGGGYVTVYPDGASPPNVSQVSYNWYTVTTEVTVQLPSWGWIDIYNGATGQADIIVDVAGYINA